MWSVGLLKEFNMNEDNQFMLNSFSLFKKDPYTSMQQYYFHNKRKSKTADKQTRYKLQYLRTVRKIEEIRHDFLKEK